MNDLQTQLSTVFLQANEGLTARVPPRPDPSSYGAPCSANRVVQAGGIMTQLLVHPSFVPFEFLFRKLPEEGVFTATPERNFVFELGAFDVPQQMTFCLLDYRFNVHRLNGAAVGDTVPIEDERLATLLGYDWLVDQYRPTNLRMEIDPVPIEATKDAFQPQPSAGVIATGSGGTATSDPTRFGLPAFAPSSGPQQATQAQFNAANFARSATPAGPGLSLLPQRTRRVGAPPPFPFTRPVRSDQTLSFQVVIFKPVPIPLAFFEVSFTGVIMPANTLEDMFEGMKPCVSPDGGR